MVDARNLDKSPDAFRTISEVADELDLPQHVLRFWETKFTHIRPVKRAGGRRYYRPDDVELLRGIRHLLYSEGYTIKGVQKILKDQGVRHVQAVSYDDEGQDMPTAPAPAVRPREEGGGIGGLLGGFLPRRRTADQRADAAPSADEPPLPFPDFASFTPRTEEAPTPRRARAEPASPPATSVRNEPGFKETSFRDEGFQEPSFHMPGYHEDEPTFAPPPQQPPLARASRKSEVPAPRRPEPAPMQQRPSRGPASRVPERPAVPELEDPLLPFFDDEEDQEEATSEALDARIRRLKEAAPEPTPAVEEQGPPEEYIPARARKRPAEPQPSRPQLPDADQGDELDMFAAPTHPYPKPEEPRLRDTGRDAAPWQERERPFADDYRPERPRTAQDRSYRQDAQHPDRQPADWGDRGDWQQDDEPYLRVPQPGRTPDRGAAPPVRADRTPPRDPFFDPQPIATPGRLGPLRGPLEEYDPEQEEPGHLLRADRRVPPVDDRRPQAGSSQEGYPQPHRVPERRASDYGLPPEPRPREPRSDERSQGRDAGWRNERERPEPEGWRAEADGDPDEDYAPPQPHRPGPPEQYLPPHLRSEPRLSGAPQTPAPLLSRDDVGRLQAALFELAECRRLMASLEVEPLINPAPPVR